MTGRIAFLDLEGTGLNEPEHRIIEACVQQYDDSGQLLGSWVWRCNPLRKIDVKAFKAHGIKLDDLANEPTFDVIAGAIRGALEPCSLVVAHNGDDYDYPFLTREMLRVGQRIAMPRTFDTMQQGRWATANGKLPRLGELATCLDVEYDPAQAHSASYDVSVMAQCFFEARRLGWVSLN